MEKAISDSIAGWVLMVSGLFIVGFMLIGIFEPPRFVRKLRRWRATSRLRKALRELERRSQAVVYWDRYRHLSKAELFAVAEEFGWHYSDQRIVPEGWALDFVRADTAMMV